MTLVNNNIDPDRNSGQKKILKNTVMLYIRMAVIMTVSLYTSRIVLDVLGIDDFGVYTIVGSVVISLAFISNTLISSTQRFLSYELGLRDNGNVSKVFSMSINIHVLFIIIVILILETIGLWFMNNALSIPEERIKAANIVYQCSILTFCSNLIRIPYNALIISFEKMNIYAILSIVEAILKLSVVFLITLFPDKLVAYGFSLLLISLAINFCYIVACKYKFSTFSRYSYIKDKTLFKKMITFSGWNLVGGITGMAANEGPNYLMNIFLGIRVNAAMGVAKQVSNAVFIFTSNFQTAFNPHIVKSYANNDREYLFDIVFKTSQLSFYLMLVFAVPIIIFSETVFSIWLVEVPPYAISFSIIMMIAQLIAALGGPLWMVVHATGDIKKYQLFISSINIIMIPSTWIVLSIHGSPNLILLILLLLNILILIYRVIYLQHKVLFPVKQYILVVFRCVIITVICAIPSIGLSYISDQKWLNVLLMIVSFIYCCVTIFFFGIPNEYKRVIIKKLKQKSWK